MEHATQTKTPNRSTRKPTPVQSLLTGPQVEIETGIPYRTLYDLYTAGHLPAVRLPGQRRLWFRRQDVDAMIENNLTKQTDTAA